MRARTSSLRISRAWLLVLLAGVFARLEFFEAGMMQLLLWQGASAVAVVRFFERGGEAGEGPRFFAGLALGVGAAHLGWRALHLGAFESEALAGFSIVFLPLGVLVSVAGTGGLQGRYAAAAFGALPLAFATARLGCLVAGCCHRPGDLVSAAVVEIAGAAGLDALLRHVAPSLLLPLVLFGLGAIRLASEPLRPIPPFGAPAVSAAIPAAGWVVAGIVLSCRRSGEWTWSVSSR